MAHILNIPLVDLIAPKLKSALSKLHSQGTKQAITEIFQKHSVEKIFGEAIYHIPSQFEADPGFQNFIETFSATSALNFDSVNEFGETLSAPDLKKLLSGMSDNDPKSRPSAEEVVLRLTQIEKTISESSGYSFLS